MKSHWLLLSLVACALLLMPVAANAQTCGSSSLPQCDGVCPLGLVCADAGGACDCLPAGGFTPCEDPGNPFGSPLCYGDCPPSTPICALGGSGCVCVPTLSEWGIIGMAFVMLGGVLFLRKRRQLT